MWKLRLGLGNKFRFEKKKSQTSPLSQTNSVIEFLNWKKKKLSIETLKWAKKYNFIINLHI